MQSCHAARHPAGAEHRDTRLLRQTVQYVDRHYAEKITVAAISAQCGYSSSHFMKRFHDLTGTSFAQYLIHFRLEKAATLLRGSRYTVLEIAARCRVQQCILLYAGVHPAVWGVPHRLSAGRR